VLTLRPARAENAECIAPLVYASGPAAWDYVCHDRRAGIDALTFLRRTLATEKTEFGYGAHTVGELDGRVVASGAGVESDRAAAHLWPTVRAFLTIYGPVAALGAMHRGLRLERYLVPPRPGEWMINHVGVVPAQRGRGLGRALVEHLIEQGRARGHRTVVLDVAVQNPAKRLYESIGFEVVETIPCGLANGGVPVPGHYRMRLKL